MSACRLYAELIESGCIKNHLRKISANVTNGNYMTIQNHMIITITYGAEAKRICMCLHP